MQQTSPSSNAYLPIEDYGLIGDLHTIALVGKNGSIDWCCLPRFDAPSVFGALLDAGKGGCFRIAPTDSSNTRYKQLYLPETNILLTRFLSHDGVGELIDFMPVKQANTAHHHIIRSVQVVHGSLSFTLVCHPAFNYARDSHQVTLLPEGAAFKSQGFHLGLASPYPLQTDGQGGVQATFTLHRGQTAHFVLESSDESEHAPKPLTEQAYQRLFRETLEYWRTWLAQCEYQGRWQEIVQRSALALKLLTYLPTGAIVAAPTTSLPETMGGTRNWDYRYTWIRDSSFTLYSLLILGFTREAEAFMGWIDARCHALHENGALQPVYGIDGEQELKECTLDHLEGYRQSRPVRIGNGAYSQRQLDIYGELMDAVYIYNRYDDISHDLWQNLGRLLNWLHDHWREPDQGIWESRGQPRHYLHSRAMSWVAFDRAVHIARDRGWPAPIDEWRKTAEEIYRQVMTQGWNQQKQSFVQYYGGDTLDGSALLLVLTHFLGAREPRFLSTLQRLQGELTSGALMYRYNPTTSDDGMNEPEGTFSACSFWQVEDLARAGRVDEARLKLEKILSYANHVSLFAEEMSPTGEALGNYPQALTHLALITACYRLDRALDAQKGRVHLPVETHHG
jgi:GH15 family glucan-1,4-alpha-glucosidase